MPSEHEPRKWLVSMCYAMAIFIVAAAGGGTPILLRVKPGSSSKSILALGTMFGGGVFIAAGFVHLLGDAASALDTGDGFPFAMLYCAIGVLIPLIIDALASSLARPAAHHAGGAGASSLDTASIDASAQRKHRHSIRAPETELIASLKSMHSSSGGGEDDGQHSSDAVATNVHPSTALTASALKPATSRLAALASTFVLFLALTVHSFIAGLVLGVSGDTLGVFVAIVAHKSFAAWALGCSFANADASVLSSRGAWAWVLGFALVTPCGIVVGTALSSFTESSTIYALLALAAGFFLYVGLMEIVAKELKSEEGGVLPRLLMLVLGFGLMAMLAIWV